MAAKKTTEIKGNGGEVLMSIEEEVLGSKVEILYEEELISVKEAGKPRYFKMLKTPYLSYHGFKVYLSREDMHNIEVGITTSDKILAKISVEDNYKA